MINPFKKRGKKLLIIGIDGVPFEMIGELTEKLAMPHLKKILETGKLVKMSVTLPEISSVSWSSFMTGTDPGNHGIFGFIDLYRSTYRYWFPNFTDLRVMTFFDELGVVRKKSIIINLPSTYPVREIPGILISGFVSIDLKKSVYPLTFLPLLEAHGYQVDVDVEKGKDQKKEFITDLFQTLRVRKKVADLLWEKEKWDLFMFTITGTDRLHHFLFDAYLDETHDFHGEFLKYYGEVDKIIGDFYAKIEGKEEFELIILSDHGFGLIDKEIYINPILKKYDFFDIKNEKDRSLEALTKDSRAFALDPSRIYIHSKKVYPRGKVEKNDYERIRKDIKQLFEEYEIDGKKVIKKVYYKEEIYSERYMDMAPDIVLLSNHGYDLKAGLKKKDEYGQSHFSGMHFQDNAFFFSTKPEFIPENMTIFDVRENILKLLNII